MRQYSLLVFDWDGTIMDSTPSIVEGIQEACRELNLPVPDNRAASWVIGLSLENALPHVVPSLTQEQAPDFIKAFRRYFVTQAPKITLFEGMKDLLLDLKKSGVLLAVATGKPRQGLDQAIDETDLHGIFDFTRCANESFPKPNPAMLYDVLGELLVEREEALMIGDTTHDLQMAKNASVDGLAVSYGAHSRTELVSLEPVALVNNVQELREYLMLRIKAWA